MTLLPMLATAGRPEDVAGPDWVHEFKWDGVRALVVVGADAVTVRSRRGNEVTAGYPELTDLAATMASPVVLDGEIVAFDADGIPSFSRLQSRMHLRDPARVARRRLEVPVTFLAFDVLQHRGSWLLDAGYEDRRTVLQELAEMVPGLVVPPNTADLAAALATAGERGLEGVVSKRRASAYRPGERSRDWRKLRLVTEQEFVVVGVRPGRSGRSGAIGSVVVGYHDDRGDLRVAGAVGSGLTGSELDELGRRLRPTTTPAVAEQDRTAERDVRWVEPTVVVQVRFREWTKDGRLRQPTYRGRRDDIAPETVVRESP